MISQAHFDALRTAQRQLNDLIFDIEKAESCGVDCSDYKQAREYLASKVDAFLAAYYPSGPPQTPNLNQGGMIPHPNNSTTPTTLPSTYMFGDKQQSPMDGNMP